jgi:hypothetical protein
MKPCDYVFRVVMLLWVIPTIITAIVAFWSCYRDR